MANPEHVRVVKQGAKAIAAWREKNAETLLDLSLANLSGANLSDANLQSAYLLGAILKGADLGRAMLSGANLDETDLVDANLSRAHLSDTAMRYADLRGANLCGAWLVRANLNGADLSGADLTGALLGATSFGGTDLTGAKGLADVRHGAPSTIGVDTLIKSQGKIPDVFLRGCGVPEELIVQLPAIVGSMAPIQFYSCFISYSSEDDAFAKRLHARLIAEKLRVWFAPEDMRGGAKFAAQIDRAIQKYDRTLLLLSEKSMKSKWVRREIKRARQKEKRSGGNVLFPIALVPFKEIKSWECLDSDSGEDLAEKVREYHVPDFSQWKDEDAFEKAFGELMRDLKASG